MPDRTVIPIWPRVAPAYSDTAALNDIQVLLTTGMVGEAALADIAQILRRTGRPMVRPRDIEITATETATGWPVARTDAGDTTVLVRQAPDGTGLLIEIRTRTAAERNALAVILDGRALHPAQPGGAT
jgi:hypothetical protein